jgi:phage tail sheath protein FI
MFNSSTAFPDPRIDNTDVSNGIRPIEGINTSVTAFIGLTRRGRANKPIKIFNFVVDI